MSDPSRELLNDTLRWALETGSDPAMAAADWLARDIDPNRESVIDLLMSREVTVEQLAQAKEAYKTMRIVGESSADRRLGARLYAATIAAALVHHGERISTQSSEALQRAMRSLFDDESMHASLRALAGTALGKLNGTPAEADPVAEARDGQQAPEAPEAPEAPGSGDPP